MPAPAHPHPHPPHPATTEGARTRLPWWALALPILAFVVLLLLVLDPSNARAADEPAAAQIVVWIRHALLYALP
ncbi:hypothetical protein GCM10010145_57870 [Streptomyces ruber]|uniref:Uncharacterized protein n=2 Tax=Streptomyces TaxID=1883 RepID=A0A918BPM1_9ACTN|nr:hypothetical protein [Streptomyces ruber]GGQ80550.1 hypothetical protein GCM10010145_57870 [Streptomyces ruber]